MKVRRYHGQRIRQLLATVADDFITHFHFTRQVPSPPKQKINLRVLMKHSGLVRAYPSHGVMSFAVDIINKQKRFSIVAATSNAAPDSRLTDLVKTLLIAGDC